MSELLGWYIPRPDITEAGGGRGEVGEEQRGWGKQLFGSADIHVLYTHNIYCLQSQEWVGRGREVGSCEANSWCGKLFF